MNEEKEEVQETTDETAVESSTTTEGATVEEAPKEGDEKEETTEENPAQKERRERKEKARGRKTAQLSRQLHTAEKDLAYYKGLAEGKAETTTTVKKTDSDPKPNADDYENHDDFVVDLGAWGARQEMKKTTKTVAEPPKTEPPKPKTEYEKKIQGFLDTTAEQAVKSGDFKTQKEFFSYAASLRIPDRVLEDALDLDNGGDVLLHLVDDPEEIERIADLSPRNQTRELEELAGRLKNAQPSKAPPPVQTVKPSKEPVEKNPDDMPIDEWMKKENAKDWKKRYGSP